MSHPPLPGVDLLGGQVRTWGLAPAGARGGSADCFGWRFVSSVTEVASPRWATCHLLSGERPSLWTRPFTTLSRSRLPPATGRSRVAAPHGPACSGWCGDRCGDEHPRRACTVAHVDPGDDIGGPNEAAPTTEAIPGGPVGPLGVPASRAALRGVSRIHFQERHPGPAGLVGEVLSELELLREQGQAGPSFWRRPRPPQAAAGRDRQPPPGRPSRPPPSGRQGRAWRREEQEAAAHEARPPVCTACGRKFSDDRFCTASGSLPSVLLVGGGVRRGTCTGSTAVGASAQRSGVCTAEAGAGMSAIAIRVSRADLHGSMIVI